MGGEATRFTRRSQGRTDSAAALEAALASSLRAELEGARWYQGKGRELASLRLVDRLAVPGSGGAMLAIVAAGYNEGAAEEYAMALRADATGRLHGAAGDDPVWPALARLALEGGSLDGHHGTVEGVPGAPGKGALALQACRPLEADQSNTSLVLDGRVVLKCYRRLRPGIHPEQELLEGLTRVGSRRAPVFHGALVYVRDETQTALATTYTYVEGEPVGWEPAIAGLTAALGGPAAELDRLAGEAAELGRCVGELHADLRAALGSRQATHADASAERERATVGVAEAIATVTPFAAELAALEPAARRELAGLDRLEGTPLQRIHGDLHVGQLLRGPAGVFVIDFEGDPTLRNDERRRLASPLQDVASLLLSLDHVAAAAARRRGFGAATAPALAWSDAARAATLAAYAAAQPGGVAPDPALLRALEIEKEWREVVYAARVLPEWLYAPRLVLQELLA